MGKFCEWFTILWIFLRDSGSIGKRKSAQIKIRTALSTWCFMMLYYLHYSVGWFSPSIHSTIIDSCGVNAVLVANCNLAPAQAVCGAGRLPLFSLVFPPENLSSNMVLERPPSYSKCSQRLSVRTAWKWHVCFVLPQFGETIIPIWITCPRVECVDLALYLAEMALNSPWFLCDMESWILLLDTFKIFPGYPR